MQFAWMGLLSLTLYKRMSSPQQGKAYPYSMMSSSRPWSFHMTGIFSQEKQLGVSSLRTSTHPSPGFQLLGRQGEGAVPVLCTTTHSNVVVKVFQFLWDCPSQANA
ncbi:unnamed protein product [Coccothraustes coccothraustes]